MRYFTLPIITREAIMEYVVTIDKFEGPLDLLLHLIKQSNIDIYDIKIEIITTQYLDYITKMEQLNLDIASAYLVMAAELIEIKSSMLLPKPEIEEDEYLDDPKEKLIQKLVEYQNYKDMVNKFHDLELDRNEYYTKAPTEITEFEVPKEISDDISLNDLIKAFEKFLNRKEITKPLNTRITNKEYSVGIRSKEILENIKGKGKIKFMDLFETYNKSYVIVTFLSILVLVKNMEIEIIQKNNFDDIELCEVTK